MVLVVAPGLYTAGLIWFVVQTCCVMLPVVQLVMRAKLLGPPGVRATVGYAAYQGYPKANEYLAVTTAMFLAIALGLLIARLTRSQTDVEEAPDAPPSRRMHAWIAYAGVFGLTLLYFLPDLLDVLRSMPGVAFQRENWDTLNWLTWDFMLTRGLRPMRDFWLASSGYPIS